MWACHSPQTASGLYLAADVGAGTTSASGFNITEKCVDGVKSKQALVFYGAACQPPGDDAVDQVLVERCGGKAPHELRQRENEVAAEGVQIARLEEVLDSLYSTYRRAFGRSYDKYRKQTAWDDGRLFLLGGGNRISAVRERLSTRPWPNLRSRFPIADPGAQDDLQEIDGRPVGAGHDFLLVAYGLSHIAADVPMVVVPGEVEEWRPTEPRLAFDGEEIYMPL